MPVKKDILEAGNFYGVETEGEKTKNRNWKDENTKCNITTILFYSWETSQRGLEYVESIHFRRVRHPLKNCVVSLTLNSIP